MSRAVDKQDVEALESIDAEELARLEAKTQSRTDAHEDERAALAKVWREQQDYALAVAEHKGDSGARRTRLAPQIALAALIATGILGAVVYSVQQQRVSEAEALRVTAELIARQEAQERARLAVEESRTARSKLQAEPSPPLAAAASAATEEAKRAEVRARALELQIRKQARRRAQAAAKKQADAMALAEERSKIVAKSAIKEAPRAAPPRPGSVFQDCAECPRMVVAPAGEFAMGSPASEAGRGRDEGPQRQVSIAPFALGRSEVTVAEFRRFTGESGYRTEAERDTRAQGCSGFVYADPASGQPAPLVTSWRSPGLAQAQADSHPVLCVSWNDARTYAQWLSKKTGKRYRLPTEAEWEYAARAGSATSRYWGDDPVQACRYANVADQSRFQTWGFGQKHDCTDGHYFTAPVAGYAPNRFGVYDMIGNVWEWTEDCWNASYTGAPQDGSAWMSGDCSQRVLRGGSWSTVPRFARSAARYKNSADYRDNLTGFRVARILD